MKAIRCLANIVLHDLKANRSESRKLKVEANFVNSTPRCGNCINMQYPLENKNGVSTGKVCRLLMCHVVSVSLCDWWTGEDGSTLDP